MKLYPSSSSIVKWVDSEWLNKNIPLVNATIIDTQPEVYDYIKAHIAGAVYFNEHHFRLYNKNFPAVFSPVECIENTLRMTGLQNERPVIVYGGNGVITGVGDGLEQSMVAYSLVRLGHEDVYVLDGGFEAWLGEGLPVDTSYPTVEESSFSAIIHNELFINYTQFLELREMEGVIVVDVRPRSVYEGKNMWIKPGHIPGAVNLPWRLLMDHENPRLLQPESQIRELAAYRDITPEKTLILYCGTGREATSAFLVFKYLLGFHDVKIYEGSFTEWCTYPRNQTVTGPQP